MREPQASPAGAQSLSIDRRRLAWLLALVPALLLGGGWLGSQFSAPASRLHPTVSLADQFVRAEGTPSKLGLLTPDDLALERARQTPKEILTQAAAIRRKFVTGGWIFGAWVGLVIGVKLISLSVRRRARITSPTAATVSPAPAASNTARTNWSAAASCPPPRPFPLARAPPPWRPPPYEPTISACQWSQWPNLDYSPLAGFTDSV